MNKGIGLFAGLTALIAMGSAQAAVCPEGIVRVNAGTNDDTGHVFEVYKANEISWEEAQACVSALDPIGLPPGTPAHLATITSSSENQWVINVLLVPSLTPSNLPEPLDKSQVWVGGVQDVLATGVGDGWRWVNNEGPFSGSNGNPDFTNWAGGEPNDGDLVENAAENHLTLGRYSASLDAWNDEGTDPGSIGGFIVEYDVPRTAACTVGVDCETIDGQTLVFPPGSFQEGDTIKFTAYEFTDPRVVNGKCTTRQPLTLFTDVAAFGSNAQLRIPPYLCGSPKFVVVAVDSSELDILKGTVLVENETTETVLPDNLYKCFDPIIGGAISDPLYSSDPQYQDVVVWQSTDPTKMLENQFGTGDYLGAATEATVGCGSSVAKVRGASYFVVGMHVDFGTGYELDSNAMANHGRFVELTRFKLTLLRKSIAAARSAGSLRPAVSTAMDALIALAIYRLDRGNPAGALTQVRQFLWLVNAANYTTVTGANYNGDHIMRGENLEFMLRVKVIPYPVAP